MSFDTNQMAYVALRSIIAERTNGVVFWVGSGVSAESGLPTWPEFKEALLKALEDKISNLHGPEIRDLRNAEIRIRGEVNNWRAFEFLRRALGETTWQSLIREILGESATLEPPSVYYRLWKLSPHGLLTLNLDRLATRAFTDVRPGHELAAFNGIQVSSYTHVLKRPHPFVCHLHGVVEDSSSWVLTSSQLSHQRANPAYKNFITSCLSTKTVVFLGISADDLAVGGFIEQLSNLGVDVGAHYWFTPRRDFDTSRWAEDRGVRLITYEAPGGDHSELLEALDDLVDFVSSDDTTEPNPVVPSGLSPQDEALPDQRALVNFETDTIRELLNQEAVRILSSSSNDVQKDYIEFGRTYDEAIYRAWYTSTDADRNQLLGHHLHEEIARGAFGKVYRANDPEGNAVAVKVLHEEMRRNEDLFRAFRRGVRSMEILGNRGVEGMVPYRRAFEIPAFVVMDWIDGPNLGEAVSSMQVSDWETVLRIGSDTADIVRRGHVLPERVLHRDLRPSNVMLRGFYTEPHDWDVVVLDFDLSWHRGALERSVTHGSALLGYLAPEQIQDLPGVSTRHASVDSFGMGMVLFYMLSGRDPVPDEHLHSDWNETLAQAAGRQRCIQWVSTPNRFARLIKSATLNNQADRWDMSQIQSELQRLRQSVLSPSSTQSTELVAEEIAARCEFSQGYVWNGDQLAAVRDLSSGVRLEIWGDESERRVYASISYGIPGVQGLETVGKWIEPALANAESILRSSDWTVENTRSNYAHISLTASISPRLALADIGRTVAYLDRALERIRF